MECGKMCNNNNVGSSMWVGIFVGMRVSYYYIVYVMYMSKYCNVYLVCYE